MNPCLEAMHFENEYVNLGTAETAGFVEACFSVIGGLGLKVAGGRIAPSVFAHVSVPVLVLEEVLSYVQHASSVIDLGQVATEQVLERGLGR